jgi:VWFA-related protein
MTKRVALVALSLSVLSSILSPCLSAADEPPRVPRIQSSAELTLTNVDVVVTDKKGTHVLGLVPDDFEVMQDGKPMKISNFQEVRPDSPTRAQGVPPPESLEAAASAPAVLPPRPPRTVVLFVDRIRIPDANERKKFFMSIEDLMRRVMTPSDRAMIVSWDRTVQSVTPFTSDFGTLEQSLDRLEKQSSGLPLEGAMLDELSRDAAWFKSIDAAIGTTSSGVSVSQRLLASRAFYEMQRKTAVVRALVSTLAGMEGKKVFLLATHRFSRYAGLEFFLTKHSQISDQIGGESREFDSKDLLESVATAANASGVTFYGLYPTGRGWESMPSAADPYSDYPDLQSAPVGGREDLVVNNEAEALELVADRTGGLVALGTHQIEKTLTRAAEDLEAYYSIAYEAPLRRPDRPASIAVHVKGRKDLVVRARQKVVEKSDDGRMKDRVLSNIFMPDRESRLDIRLIARPADKRGSRKRLNLQVRIPIAQLVLLPDRKGEGGAFSVFVAAAGPKGELSAVTQQRKEFQIQTEQLEKAKASYYTYEMTVETNGPESILSVGVLDETSKEAGFGRLLIPALKKGERDDEPVRPMEIPDPFARPGRRSRL